MTDKIEDPAIQHDEQGMFAEHFNIVMDDFGKACEQNKIDTSIAIAIHPEHDHPMVFCKGHKYDVTVLLTKVLKQLRADIEADLDIG
jgi:hypothetical protein